MTQKIGLLNAAIIFLFSVLLLCTRLGEYSINHNSDEVIQTRVIQESVIEGNYFPLTHGNRPYLNKPPLFFMSSALVVSSLGESNFSYRLASVLSGVLLLVIIFIWCLVTFQSYVVAYLAPLTLLSMIGFIHGMHGIREATQDGMLVLLVFCAQMIWLQASKKQSLRLAMLSGICGSLAFLTKSVAGFIAPISIFILIIAQRRWKLDYKNFGAHILFCVIPSGIYLFCLWLRVPRFLDIMFYREVGERFQLGMHNAETPWLYVEQLLGTLIPPAPILPSIVILMILLHTAYSIFYHKKINNWGIGVFFLTPIILYSVLPSRQPWYIAPAMPWLAITVACSVASLLQSSRTRVLGAIALLMLIWQLSHSILRAFVPSQRLLKIDALQSEIRSKQQRVLLFASDYTEAANPKRGRFNVEALYTRMLRDSRVIVKGQLEFLDHLCNYPFDYVVVEDPSFVSLHKPIDIIPAFSARKNDFKVYEARAIKSEFCLPL